MSSGRSLLSCGGSTEKGLTLTEYIQAHGRDVLGTNCKRFADFPILIKFIDARGNMSIQVHPDNAYAREHENRVRQDRDVVYYRMRLRALFSTMVSIIRSAGEMEQRIRENTLLEVLHKEPVEKGDVLCIPSGTIHAICRRNCDRGDPSKNSNVTYRVYDYGRLGADGKPRALHVQGTGCNKKRTCSPGSSLCPPSGRL
ncbi:MAG: type I phosphomannose isomerase catalytic subunit [Lachnospiraceae bacterium]